MFGIFSTFRAFYLKMVLLLRLKQTGLVYIGRNRVIRTSTRKLAQWLNGRASAL